MGNKPNLDWETAMTGEVLLLMNEVSKQDGTCSFMFGGYGYYYKISWSVGGRHDFISAETPERLSELAIQACSSGRLEAPGSNADTVARRGRTRASW